MDNQNTKYQTGVWYGWNGGECPVHPETVVEVTNGSDKHVMKANSINWNFAIAFRIVTPYVPIADATEPKKPREFWIVDGAHVYKDKTVALQDMADFHSKDIALFREVVEADE